MCFHSHSLHGQLSGLSRYLRVDKNVHQLYDFFIRLLGLSVAEGRQYVIYQGICDSPICGWLHFWRSVNSFCLWLHDQQLLIKGRDRPTILFNERSWHMIYHIRYDIWYDNQAEYELKCVKSADIIRIWSKIHLPPRLSMKQDKFDRPNKIGSFMYKKGEVGYGHCYHMAPHLLNDRLRLT